MQSGKFGCISQCLFAEMTEMNIHFQIIYSLSWLTWMCFFVDSVSQLCVFISRFVNGMAGAVNVSTFGSIEYSSASNYSLISNGK